MSFTNPIKLAVSDRKPNLFDFATKELSQDAFIAWLLQWGDSSNKQYDPSLTRCGQEFVKKLICKAIPAYSAREIKSIRAGRQWENIDIWAEVNDEILIIIEDKTNTMIHSNQLERYQKIAEKWCSTKGYQLVCIYLKTGSESNSIVKSIEDKGYSVIDRKELISFFNEYPCIKNNIFTDFKDRMVFLESAEGAFQTTPICEWNDACWKGFYQLLEQNRPVLNWGYVNNFSGGFWNALLNWHQWGDFPLYMQIEQGNLCFKLSTHPEDTGFEGSIDHTAIRNECYHSLIAHAQKAGLSEIKKPRRFGKGKYMTVAMIEQDDWLGSQHQAVQIENAIAKLSKYESFLEDFINL